MDPSASSLSYTRGEGCIVKYLDKLAKAQAANNSWLCVGLDPQPEKIGKSMQAVFKSALMLMMQLRLNN